MIMYLYVCAMFLLKKLIKQFVFTGAPYVSRATSLPPSLSVSNQRQLFTYQPQSTKTYHSQFHSLNILLHSLFKPHQRNLLSLITNNKCIFVPATYILKSEYREPAVPALQTPVSSRAKTATQTKVSGGTQ